MCHLIWYFYIKQGRNGHSADVFEWLIEQLMTLIKRKTLSQVNLQGAIVRKNKIEGFEVLEATTDNEVRKNARLI